MCKICFVLACFTVSGDGRRLRSSELSRESFNIFDGLRSLQSHNEVNHSGSVAKARDESRHDELEALGILLGVLSPAVAFQASVPKAPTELPLELHSGDLQARIQHKKHPLSWDEFKVTGGLALGMHSEPLFEILSDPQLADTTCTSIASEDCDVLEHEQTDKQIRLRLQCPQGIEAVFEINTPAHDVSAGYLRVALQLWTRSGTWEEGLTTLRLLQFMVPDDEEILLPGLYEVGLPVVIGRKLFVGVEHPMAFPGLFESNKLFIDIRHLHELPPPTEKEPWRFGAVVGTIPETSQSRRAFVNYLHNERPGRRTPMVHYNSWFDFTGWQDAFNPGTADLTDVMTEASCMQRVKDFGEHLIKQHNVQVDSFLLDDGWDDTTTLWEFDSVRFPRELSKVAATADEYGSGIGIWLSPWGGYGDSKRNRVREGKMQGFETKIDQFNEERFDLAGTKYRAWFMQTITKMCQDQGVNMFKFDGTNPAAREMEAMLSMVAEVRRIKAKDQTEGEEEDEIWINLTTGTWPSPFFLFWADSIWRGDADVGPYPGTELPDGLSQRQKWIRWRAEKVQQHVVQPSAYFPLSQLMIHGVVLAGHGDALYTGLGEVNDIEFSQEIWSFIGMGLQLQELYISPDRMTESMWALLAEGLTWSRQNSKVLLDSHWVFGDVPERQVFCVASWDPDAEHGFVMLQNTMGSTQDTQLFSLDDALELPRRQTGRSLKVSVVKSVPGKHSDAKPRSISQRLKHCKKSDDQDCIIEASKKTSISLQHTEVLVLQVELV